MPAPAVGAAIKAIVSAIARGIGSQASKVAAQAGARGAAAAATARQAVAGFGVSRAPSARMAAAAIVASPNPFPATMGHQQGSRSSGDTSSALAGLGRAAVYAAGSFFPLAAIAREFGSHLIDARKGLEQYNAVLAGGRAKLDVGRLRRDIIKAQQIGGTGRALMESQNRLEESLRPASTFFANATNVIATGFNNVIAALSDAVKPGFDALNKLFGAGAGGDPAVFRFLSKTADATEAKRNRPDMLFP